MSMSSSPELVNITFHGKRDSADMIKDLQVQEVILAHPGGPKYKPKGRQRERKPWLQCRRTWWDQRQGWEWCREEPPEAARGEDPLTSWSLQKEQALLTSWFQLLKTHLDLQPPELLKSTSVECFYFHLSSLWFCGNLSRTQLETNTAIPHILKAVTGLLRAPSKYKELPLLGEQSWGCPSLAWGILFENGFWSCSAFLNLIQLWVHTDCTHEPFFSIYFHLLEANYFTIL